MDIEYGKWTENSESVNLKRIKGQVKSVPDSNTYAMVALLNDNTGAEIKLINKSLEILKAGDYVTIEYAGIFSSKTACIVRRNGSPRFTAYNKVLTQTEYDTLEANDQIVDSVMYVIVGDWNDFKQRW